MHLLGRDPAAQHGRSYISQAGLLLRMYAGMVTENARGDLLRDRRIELETKTALDLFQKALRRPALLQEEKLQPRSLAVFAQAGRIVENPAHGLGHGNDLVPAHESVEPHRQVRIGRKPAAYPNREPHFTAARNGADRRSECQIVDLGIRAPVAAAA